MRGQWEYAKWWDKETRGGIRERETEDRGLQGKGGQRSQIQKGKRKEKAKGGEEGNTLRQWQRVRWGWREETGEMDRKERSRGKRWEEEEGKLWGQRAYKWAERDLLVCQSFRSHPLPWGKKKRKERGETLTLHYLCLALLAQAHAASHCVFIMRNRHEAKEEETQPGGQYVCCL